MPTPIVFNNYIETIAEDFGGLGVVQIAMPENKLQTLLTYPGFIAVVKPWACELDIQNYGYRPGSLYTVYDSDRNKLYSSASDGYFGKTANESALLTQAAHADYWIISFDTDQGPVTGLLWICKIVNPYATKEIIKSWKSQTKILDRALDQHEAFISTSKLLPTDNVKVYFLPGTWGQHLTVADLQNHPSSQLSVTRADGVINLYPKQTGWYLFELKRFGESYLLKLENIKGPATNRIRSSVSGTYFVQLGSVSGVPKTIFGSNKLNSSLLPSLAKPISRSLDPDYIHLEAELDIVDKHFAFGSSVSEALLTVKTSIKVSPLDSYSKSRASIGTSMQVNRYIPFTRITNGYDDSIIWDDTRPWEYSVSNPNASGPGTGPVEVDLPPDPYPGEDQELVVSNKVIRTFSATAESSSYSEAIGFQDSSLQSMDGFTEGSSTSTSDINALKNFDKILLTTSTSEIESSQVLEGSTAWDYDFRSGGLPAAWTAINCTPTFSSTDGLTVVGNTASNWGVATVSGPLVDFSRPLIFYIKGQATQGGVGLSKFPIGWFEAGPYDTLITIRNSTYLSRVEQSSFSSFSASLFYKITYTREANDVRIVVQRLSSGTYVSHHNKLVTDGYSQMVGARAFIDPYVTTMKVQRVTN